MSYVAAKGGENSIKGSIRFYFHLIKKNKLLFLIDKVMSEGSLYSEKFSKKAIDAAGGDNFVAAFYLRAHRTTCRRLGKAKECRLEDFRVIRRISSAFKDIKGGQILGPTNDYLIKVLSGMNELLDESGLENNDFLVNTKNISSAVDVFREQGLVHPLVVKEDEPADITLKSPLPPYSRSACLQIMARGETGGMLLLAYTSMRGYGDIHPTIGDLRIGYLDIIYEHPLTGKKVKVGEVRATSCEVVGSAKIENKLKLTVGYGFCFGFNETKAIAMSIIDNAMNYPTHTIGGNSLCSNKELVLMHIDSIESVGFCNHYKLPHYVTFSADLCNISK